MDRLGPYLLGPNDTPENGIYTGDARELAKVIPDESIDLIFTDPPYYKEFVPLYGWLSGFGARVLKPGHFLYVYAGIVHPEVIGLITSKMHWHWAHIVLNADGGPSWWKHKIRIGYKPVFVVSKGDPVETPWMRASHYAPRDKQFHKWGQSIDLPLYIINKITQPGDIVVDPLVGGGTMPAVCKMLGRKYLAFEIDPDVAETARKRVRTTQMPLFVLEPEQMTLGGD